MMITTAAGSSLFHSPHQLIVGHSPLVGVLDLPGTIKRPPIRLFFPASTTTTTTRRLTPAKYFVNNRVAYVLQGFAHIVLARHTTKVFRFILRPLLWLVSLIFPARFLIIPDTVHVRKENVVDLVKYVPPSELSMDNDGSNSSTKKKKDKTQSLVMFSHGLTGTGEENSIFCTSLAKRGHVVASIHHRDGSSSRVPLADGTCLYYKHLPTGDEYNPHDRLEQVHYRAQELLYATSWMMGEVEEEEGEVENNGNKNDDTATTQVILNQIRSNLSQDNIIASGFSYGSATVALASTLQSQRYKCAVLLDPWLHIDYSSKGYEFDFPPEVFGKPWPESSTNDDKNANTKNDGTTIIDDADDDSSLKQSNGGRGLNTPAIFINSSQFAGYTKLYGATCRLADIINSNSNNKSSSDNDDEHPRAEMHIIDDTTHQNFCDTIFWLPRRIAKKIFGLGDADAYDAYESILNLTNKFLDRF